MTIVSPARATHRLGGWWRIWIVLSALWVACVGAVVATDFGSMRPSPKLSASDLAKVAARRGPVVAAPSKDADANEAAIREQIGEPPKESDFSDWVSFHDATVRWNAVLDLAKAAVQERSEEDRFGLVGDISRAVWKSAPFALIPPLTVLALGLAAGWIIAGFRQGRAA